MTTKEKPVIRAECHSDNFQIEIQFDAVKWFRKASNDDILDLAQCGWGGDYPADRVAEFFEKTDTKDLFHYIWFVQKYNQETMGFECHVDMKDAIAWLKKHRPGLCAKLTKVET